MRAVRTSVITSLLLAGCSFHSSSAPTDGHGNDSGSGTDAATDAEIDGPPDAPPDAPRQDFGTGVWTVHVPTLPTQPVVLPAMIDTNSSTLCSLDAAFVDASQPAACIIVGTTITTTGTTNVRGPKPIVLVATDSVMISDALDVASHRMQQQGPGANWSGCGSPGGGADRDNGGGGGAGGSFITAGANGATGDNGNASAGTATAALAAPTLLHGGCPGADGGDGNTNDNGGPGANGGGAIYIVAANAISVTGLINASGAGALGGGHYSGGGGGGSGGMIVLYAPQIDATGKLLANGGGGAGGGDNNSNGMSGSDEMVANPLTAPPGGNGPGGPGGDGFTQGTDATIGGAGGSNRGGGGGGGGAGFIGINVAVTGGTYTPSPTTFP
jgi:hypothetical protein